MGRAERISRRRVRETNLPAVETPNHRRQEITVNRLNQLGLTIGRIIRRVRLLPQTIMNRARQRQQQMVLNELEVERLDRIRNPEKYRGK